MTQYSFNLAVEPWIPVLPPGGGLARYVGLYELLTKAETFGAIHDDSPLATVGLLRLSIALLYQALGGPLNKAEWRELWRAQQFPKEKLDAYFAEWNKQKEPFDLFSPTHPFFQTAHLTMKEDAPLSRLATEAASGNNATLFDHRSDDTPQALTPAQAARLLIAAQNYALGFGKAADAIIGENTIARPYAADAITLRGVTIFLTGRNLYQTFLLNMPPLGDDYSLENDLPCWQRDDPSSLMDRIINNQRVTEEAKGVIDRYTWQSRLIRLLPERDAAENLVVRNAFFTQGRSADKTGSLGQRDPMKAFVQFKTEGFIPVALNAEKAAWRDVHGLLALSSGNRLRPLVLDNVAELTNTQFLPPDTRYRLNIVGLATEPGKAGKFLLWRHDRMNLPSALLIDTALLERLALLMRDSEDEMGEKKSKTSPGRPDGVARQLGNRTRRLCKLFLAPESDDPNARQPDPKDIDRLASDIDPRPAYWARLESHFYELVEGLPNDIEVASDTWRNAVEREAGRAMKEACTALGYASDSRSSIRAIAAMARIPFGFTCGDFAAAQIRRERTRQPIQPDTLADAVEADSEEISQREELIPENGDTNNE